ncbi:MAG TPA: SCP2 sterol-binding domain-containing protein [Steroidobacteraceae bacterium]
MLTATLENLLNRGLPRSPRARQLCAALTGRSVAIVVPDIARLRVSSTGDTLAVTLEDAPTEATIRGGLLSLLALTGDSAQKVAQRGEVTISGDSEVAARFRELVQLLRPDPEEELALLIGDIPAHQLGRLARLGASFSVRAAETTLRNLAEYWAHERGDLVSRNEGEQFLRGVDALREDTDRLQARLDLLAQRRGDS